MPARLIGPRRQAGTFYKKRPTSKKATAKISAPMRKAVVKVIASQQESKQNTSQTVSVNFNSSITSTAEFYSCIPTVALGTESFERVGQSIRPTRLECNWSISHQNVTRSGDQRVVLYVLRHKGLKSFPAVQSLAVPGELLTAGQGGVTGFNGYVNQCDLPINTERYTLVKKFTIPINKNVGVVQNNTATGDSPITMHTAKHIKAVFKLPKLLYDEGTAVNPNNQALFWCLGYAHPDGSAPDTVNQDIIVSSTMNLFYKDA